MNIRNRLTLQFTIIVSCIIFFFAITIFTISSNYRNTEFFYRIKKTAINTAKLYLDIRNSRRNKKLKVTDYTLTTFQQKETHLYDSVGKHIFSLPLGTPEPGNIKEIIEKVNQKDDYIVYTNAVQTIAFKFTQKNKTYYIQASAQDIEGMQILDNLRLILFFGLCIMIALTGISGYFFSYRALKPIQDIVSQATSISAENLSQRITVRKEKDEIYNLTITFNEMLNRLENAFEMQKHFVANVSHELRTPLTSITGQLEVNLMNTRTIDEYKETITSILFDIKTLNQIVNNLLYLTETRLDKSNIPIASVRIDELLYLAKILELKKHHKYTIDFNLSEFPEEESQLTILGNEQLLTVVFLNLIDNACKYSSDNKVTVSLKSINKTIEISFIDNGIGIPQSDLEIIFLPFQRASNSKEIKGHGIGLSLVKNIIEIHDGKIDVNSVEGNGSTFIVTLQNNG
jgi:signal transduction histidine kinase